MTNVKALRGNAKKEAEHLLSELWTLGDEIRLKAHLANAEGREAWKGLEPQLLQFRRRLETCSEGALSELRSAGNRLRANLERLRKELQEPPPDAPHS
ncbi:MAG TPA: hypothetical protein VFS67_14595 [Polyangiaceae bacterium]|jgi:hypothetical protein|nr:hypothetical protein [Polyangiaceae bacterium]